MSLDVIGAGFGRTGTLSMKLALEQLGYDPCYHMQELGMPRPGHNDGHLDAWHDFAVEGKPIDWRWLLKGYRACVDFRVFSTAVMERFARAGRSHTRSCAVVQSWTVVGADVGMTPRRSHISSFLY
jgi:hypothetical protein